MKDNYGCLAALGLIMLFLVVWAGSTAVVMLLWNFVVVSIFNAPVLSFWQTAALCFLLNIVGQMFKK